MKRNKGITLIALVITIIVLLILAGVAISMLSGENGILRKAAEAKTKTEEKSREEQIKLAIMGAMDGNGSKIDKEKIAEELGINKNDINGNAKDIIVKRDGKTFNVKNGEVKEVEEIKEIDNVFDDYFQSKGSNYKCRYGMITGVEIENVKGSLVVKDTVDNVNSALPEGYKVAETDGTAKVTTGMKVVKETDESEVANIIVFGEINGDKIIDISDVTLLDNIVNGVYKENEEYTLYQKVAGNVVDDDELNTMDSQLIMGYTMKYKNKEINQQRYAVSKESVKRHNNKLKEFIEAISEKSPYKLEYDEEKDTYTLKGVNKGTKCNELKNNLPTKYEYIIYEGLDELSDDTQINSNIYLAVTVQYEMKDNRGVLKSYDAEILILVEIK